MTSGTTTNEESTARRGSSPPASLRRMAVFVGGALILGAGLAIWLGSAQPDRHFGFLHSVNETITAGRQARITRLLVKPGQVVAPGTALLTLQDASLEVARIQQQQAIAALEAELHQAQARASVEIADRKAKLEAELFETQIKLAAFEEKRFDQRMALFASENRVMLAQAEERLAQVQIAAAGEMKLPFEPLTVSDARQNKPHKRDFLFELQERETTRNKLETSEAQVDLCEDRLEMLKKQLEGVAAQINEAFGVNVIQTRLTSAQASLAKLDAEAPTLTVTASKHGTVGIFNKAAGELIGPRDTIVELFDADQPYVLAEVPTSKLLQFSVGADVNLLFPGNVRRIGTISELPPQAASLPGPGERLADRGGLLRIQILPKGKVWPQVPFGTYVEVSSYPAAKTGVSCQPSGETPTRKTTSS